MGRLCCVSYAKKGIISCSLYCLLQDGQSKSLADLVCAYFHVKASGNCDPSKGRFPRITEVCTFIKDFYHFDSTSREFNSYLNFTDPHGELKGVNVLTAVGTDRSGIMAEFGISSEAELDAHLERARKVS